MPTSTNIDAFVEVLRQLGVLFAQVAGQQSASHASYSKPELMTVDVLGVRGACRMGDLAEHLGVVRSAITPLIDRLEDQGIVRRLRGTDDRRVWHVELTTAGEALYHEQAKVYRAIATQMLGPLTEAEQATLITLLSRIGAPAPAG